MKVPAYCEKCGAIFVPPIFEIAGNAKGISIHNVATPCPKCGGLARFIDGTFDSVEGQLVPRNAPPITHAVLAAVKRMLEEAADKATDSESLIAEIDKISPQIAVVLKPLAKYKAPAFIIAVVYLMLHALHINLTLNIKIDMNDLFAQAIAAAEGAGDSPSHEHVVQQTTYNVIQTGSQSQTAQGPPRQRLRQPQLRPKKKQGKLGPRWRPKRTHPFA